MKSFWTRVLEVLDILTFSPWSGTPRGGQHPQQPLLEVPSQSQPNLTHGGSQTKNYAANHPKFTVPNGPGSETFFCEYESMVGWEPCIDDKDSNGGYTRNCWLKHPDGRKFDIHTDFDDLDVLKELKGTTRTFYLTADHMTLEGDGYQNPYGKVFNKQYPGPWITACWGDTIIVHVKNDLRWNGTTVHWHGLVQKGSTEMDGVNAISQCPIAPGETFEYKFRVTQYGTTWYHSHYSLQYGDGLLGPLTIFGPSSAGYDEAVDPLLMTDYNHRSAFEDFYKDLNGEGFPEMTNMLMNGVGRYTCKPEKDSKCTMKHPPLYSPRKVKKGKYYLLRIINTSVDTTFVFTIDHHMFYIAQADLVPVKIGAAQNHLLVGIGQRYHILVYTAPLDENKRALKDVSDSDMKFWIRTLPADGCNKFENYGKDLDPKLGIFRYEGSSDGEPLGKYTNQWPDIDLTCRDEDARVLKPVVPWKVDAPSNQMQEATLQAGLGPKGVQFYHPQAGRWQLGEVPMWLNFSAPTLLHHNLTKDGHDRSWNETMVMLEPETYPGKVTWIYMLITSTGFPFSAAGRRFVPTAHPIHLHGHDFAVLASSDKPYWPNQELIKMNRDNPMRRDTALLPANGYLMIAFKADNPGVWIMHCHIAWHASSGFAIQFVERWKDLMEHMYDTDFMTLRPEHQKLTDGCESWDKWYANPKNFWNSWEGHEGFQDDSGI